MQARACYGALLPEDDNGCFPFNIGWVTQACARPRRRSMQRVQPAVREASAQSAGADSVAAAQAQVMLDTDELAAREDPQKLARLRITLRGLGTEEKARAPQPPAAGLCPGCSRVLRAKKTRGRRRSLCRPFPRRWCQPP